MLRDPFQQHEASPPATPPLPAATDGDADEAFLADFLDQSCILNGQDLPMPADLCAAVARGCMLSIFDILAKWRTSEFLQNQAGGEIHASLTAQALRLAMVQGRADIVSLLVAVRGTQTGDAEMALSAGKIGNFEALLWNGWDINAPILPTGPTALGYVVYDTALTKWFLEHGADPNGGYQYETAFSCAAGSGSIEIIEMFLDRGADILRGDILYFASGRRRNAVEVTNFLLSRGADPNRLRFDGLEPGWSISGLKDGLGTPLHYAIRRHRLDIVLALVKAGADLSVQDTLARTPRMLAELRHNAEVLALLDAHK